MKVDKLVEILNDKKLKIATAESCTGGLLAKKITDVSGASNVFEFGIVSYSNRIKNEFLKVEKDILDIKGAVCEETAAQMAVGVTDVSNADIGVGITGFAGPTGDDVGLVFVSIYDRRNEKTIVNRLKLSGGRDEIREEASSFAVDEVLKLLEQTIK